MMSKITIPSVGLLDFVGLSLMSNAGTLDNLSRCDAAFNFQQQVLELRKNSSAKSNLAFTLKKPLPLGRFFSFLQFF